jgi:putative SOS response-associated peptidase YedK
MYGQFILNIDDSLYRRFKILGRMDTLTPCFNIAPGPTVPVITEQNRDQLLLMHWDLIPHGTKERITCFKMINARMETLTEKPAYPNLLATHRCVVPASDEWKREGCSHTCQPASLRTGAKDVVTRIAALTPGSNVVVGVTPRAGIAGSEGRAWRTQTSTASAASSLATANSRCWA